MKRHLFKNEIKCSQNVTSVLLVIVQSQIIVLAATVNNIFVVVVANLGDNACDNDN